MTTPTTIAGGEGSRILDPRRMIVRDAGAWRALWAVHAGPETQTPDVDFATHIVAAAFAGERPSAGFEIEITGARERNGGMEVLVEERSPAPGMMAAQMIVTPFHIVALPRHDGEVRFADGEAQTAPRVAYPAMPPASRPRTPSSTGLSPRTAAGLAYLAGPFSGILVLLAERTNRFVRFHAYQSILALGGLGLLALVFLVSAFAALLISPWAFTLMYWLAFVMAIIWIGLWAVCLFHAFRGRAFKLPLIGPLAARRAGAGHSSH
jgi:uncharacterized membrane protein